MHNFPIDREGKREGFRVGGRSEVKGREGKELFGISFFHGGDLRRRRRRRKRSEAKGKNCLVVFYMGATCVGGDEESDARKGSGEGWPWATRRHRKLRRASPRRSCST